jgi:hypothetical protein
MEIMPFRSTVEEAKASRSRAVSTFYRVETPDGSIVGRLAMVK